MQIKDIKTKANLKELFINIYGWENVNDFNLGQVSIGGKIFQLLGIAQIANSYIIYCDLGPTTNLKQLERAILNDKLSKPILFGNIYIFSGDNGNFLDFVKADSSGKSIKLKRFAVNPDNRKNDQLRTTTEQLSELKFSGNQQITATTISNKIDQAFSVDSVAENFYNGYDSIFRKIHKEILKQAKVSDTVFSSDIIDSKVGNFAHLFLDRLMFLYFIQKRGCFNSDKDFICNTYWDTYRTKFNGQNKFYSSWLNSLFFEALSKPDNEYKNNPDIGNLNEVLKKVPYLNGGLFIPDENLDKNGWYISDSLFNDIFAFFQGYNFTVEESTPLDIDIAINPEMLGNIYEHLINVSEIKGGENPDTKSKKSTEGHSSGIFYTPKTEIDLMLKRSLVEFLYQKTKLNKDDLYRFIFDEQSGEQIENPFKNQDSTQLLVLLEDITILDPACGSGHYLVAAAQLLYRLRKVLSDYIGRGISDKYKAKKEIIERNIYGNDVKKWAVEIAKLRLWLDLFVDAGEEYLMQQYEPILPNLDFKIRVGDSLIQRIGDTLIPLRAFESIEQTRQNDLHYFIEQKKAVYEGKQPAKQVNYLERKLIQNILSDSIIKAQKEIQSIKNEINKSQPGLFKAENISEVNNKIKREYVNILATKENELKELEKNKKEIGQDIKKELPMIWDIAFAEIFKSKNGFDIVIANPPYVRQEEIADPCDFYKKAEYKNKLLEQLQLDYTPDNKISFGNKIGEQFIQLSKQSDLYIYFYLKGLKLLNPEGILCYISSNSWLDVGYGTALQEVLLKRVPVMAIYDNQVKRSFAHASVNTIIFISKAPLDKDWDNSLKDNEITFVNFKKSFEEINYSEVFIGVENKNGFKELPEGKRKTNEAANIHILNQENLYNYGVDKQTQEYIGNKWGGKYLRAPEIYWTILEKGKDKLVKLGDVAEVRFGIKTGANEFFYLTDEQARHWKIEKEFLRPIIKSPRECKSILINPNDLKYKVFICNRSKEELKGTNALKYIEWGESKKFHKKPTTAGRKKWWDLGCNKLSNFLWTMTYRERFFVIANSGFLVDARMYDMYSKNYIGGLCNSTFILLQLELMARGYGGGGGPVDVKVYEVNNLLIPDLKDEGQNLEKVLFSFKSREIKTIFEEYGINPNSNISIMEQRPMPLPDRAKLDQIVFDALGLTENERKEVYRAVCQLVWNRISKAKSV